MFILKTLMLTFCSSNFKQVQLQGSALVSQGCQK